MAHILLNLNSHVMLCYCCQAMHVYRPHTQCTKHIHLTIEYRKKHIHNPYLCTQNAATSSRHGDSSWHGAKLGSSRPCVHGHKDVHESGYAEEFGPPVRRGSSEELPRSIYAPGEFDQPQRGGVGRSKRGRWPGFGSIAKHAHNFGSLNDYEHTV